MIIKLIQAINAADGVVDIENILEAHGWRPEHCICAAIKATDGSIIRGQRHADAIGTCMEKGKNPDIGNGYDGFVTSTGRFVDRFEGYKLQVAAGIESIARGGYRGIRLFSEDLY